MEDFLISDGKTLNTNMVTLNGVSVIDPSECTWGLQDVSASDAGRDEGATMHKMRVAQKRQFHLGWSMIDPVNASIILKAVNALEYFECTLFDAMECEYQTRTYYVGDRSAPMQQWMPDRVDGKIYTKLSFTLIER